jgi:predicted permease
MKQSLRIIWSRLWARVRNDRLDRDFDEELTTHLELLIDEGRRNGLSPAGARRQALLRLGRPDLLREEHREQRGVPVLDVLAQDLRYTVRMMRKAPGFTAVVTLTLALGIGANTALFSLVDDLLLRSLPISEPDRVVQIRTTVRALGLNKPFALSPPAFEYLTTHNQVLSEILAFQRVDRPVVTVDGAMEPSKRVEQVSENFFRDLGVVPAAGRFPAPSDGAVAVIGHGWWHTRFGGSDAVVGRILTVNGRSHSIVGVAPPRFHGLSIEDPADVWISTRGTTQQLIARLEPEVSPTQAQAALQLMINQLAKEMPGALPGIGPNMSLQVDVLPAGKGISSLRQQYRRPLLALTVLVTLVLLITCTNVGNLLMVRSTSRKREVTVRVALGAGRTRIIVQYLLESAVLALLGGVLGLVIARWGVSILLSMLPLVDIPEALAFEVDARVLGFAALVSLASALLFGLVPAWRATECDLSTALRTSQTTTPTRSARRLGRLLVGCQVALSVLLLIGAGLFVQTLRNLNRLDLGFDPGQLLQVSVDTRSSGYGKGQVGPLYRLLLERVAAIPGVRSVTAIRNPLMGGGASRGSMTIPGVELAPNESWDVADIGPAFFETMGITVLQGRTFSDADFRGEQRAVVINEAFARRYFPGRNAVGIRVGGRPDFEIIGVVRNARLNGVRIEAGPMMYWMAPTEPDRFNALEVRTAGDPASVARAVRDVIGGVNPRLLIDIRTMDRQIDYTLAQERMVAATSAFFGLLGLLLASIGIFGVAASTVSQKTTELGIRMALGADRWSIVRESLRDTMLVFAAGLVAGLILAIVVVRLTSSFIAELLFGLTATDAVSIVAAVLVMVAVALIACILPAHRATRIDPITAIRCE